MARGLEAGLKDSQRQRPPAFVNALDEAQALKVENGPPAPLARGSVRPEPGPQLRNAVA
jgi:hypothetical protein